MTMLVLSPSVEAMKASASLDPGGDQRVDLEAGADRELAAEVLPALVEPDLEPGVRLGVLVEAGDLVALAQHRPGDRGADPAAADDQDEQGVITTAGV